MIWRFLRLPAAAGPEPVGADANGPDANGGDTRWVDVGGLADLHANRLVVDMNGTSVLVVRIGRSLAAIENECPHLGQRLSAGQASGRVIRIGRSRAAVENECPHLGQRLSDGQVSGRVIRCAAHGYRWDLATGRSVAGLRVQRRRPLREGPVRLDGDRIMLAWTEG